MHNPYAAPASSPLPQSVGRPRRPISVGLLMLFMLPVLVTVSAGLLRWTWYIFTNPVAPSAYLVVVAELGWRVALLAFLIVTLRAIRRGFPYRRWLGLIWIAAMIIGNFVVTIDTSQYANEGQLQGAMMARNVVAPLIMILWAHVFGFSSKARRYFARVEVQSQEEHRTWK